MSFGPISALGPRFTPSKYFEFSSGCDPQLENQKAGNPATRGNLAATLILNQNPIFEIASKKLI